MHSEDEIVEMFKLMGLYSREEREQFEKMSTLEPRTELERPCLFIRAGSGSTEMEWEGKDAELEANP